MAQPAGTICEPGKPAWRRMRSRADGGQARAGTGTGRRTGCGSCRGVRSSWRTSATSAVDGPRAGRAVRRRARRGSRAKPSSLRISGDGRRAERLALACQRAADVVDGEVLLAQGDDLLAQPIAPWGRPAALWRGRKEEVPVGVLAELMDEDAEAPGV